LAQKKRRIPTCNDGELKMVKKILIICCLLACFSCVELQAKQHKHPHKTEKIAIHTYGGGKLLKTVFSSISLLIYGNSNTGLGKTFFGILRLAIAIGGFSAVMMAFSKGSFLPFIQGWFLPALGISTVLLIPRSTLNIEDHLTAKSGDISSAVIYKVDDVPFFLAQFSSITSWLSYKFTSALEDVTHGTNDPTYNWTGHIYAGESLFQAGQVRLNNPIIEQNLKNFCHQCIFNDLNINPPSYTRSELLHAKDILSFLQEKTTPWLSFSYQDQTGEVAQLKCSEGIKKIKEQFDHAHITKPLSVAHPSQVAQEGDLAKMAIIGEVGSAASLLLGQSNAAMSQQKKLMQQHYLIDTVKNSTNANYTKKKAEYNYQQTQKTLGALSATSIVSMRTFFEAVVYMSFPLVLILAIVSFGFKALANWAQFLLWINLWPHFLPHYINIS